MEWIAPALDWAKTHQAIALVDLRRVDGRVAAHAGLAVGWTIVAIAGRLFQPKKNAHRLSTWEQHSGTAAPLRDRQKIFWDSC